ncbi:UDP-N-acetylglucosamine transferase subunit ALG14 [Pelodytes ibericus]
MMLILAVFIGFLVGTSLLVLRIRRVLRPPKPCRKRYVSLLVIAGSGGHTTEMLRLLGSLSKSYTPTHYVIAETDRMSKYKINSFERSKILGLYKPLYFIHRIPRSREVKQSWTTSFLTSLYSFLYSFPLTARLQPDVILCNGPGTCVPICLSALLLGILGVKKIIVVYVESICRVESLSLTGRILYYFSHFFFVQWPSLKEKYPKSIYLGRLV